MEKSFTEESIERNINELLDCFSHMKDHPMDEYYQSFWKKVVRKNYTELAYPSNPNWEFSIPLVPNYKMKDGSVVDIGMCINDAKFLKETGDVYAFISRMYVMSEEDSDYYSGSGISLLSEMDKAALKQLLLLRIIKEDYLEKCVGRHNNMLWGLLESNLTLWDLERVIKQDKGESK